MIYVKINNSGESNFVAVCDKEVLGKTLKDKNSEFRVSKELFKGELKNLDSLEKILKEYKNIMLVGNNCVKRTKELGFVSDSKKIGGVEWTICLKI